MTQKHPSERRALADQAVLITGASRGLGRALAQQAAKRGARVGLVARGVEPLEQAVAEIRRGGGIAHALAADVADRHAIHPVVGRARAVLGEIDVLINNASQLGPTPLRPLLDTECEDFEAVLQTNLLGPFRLAKALLGPMVLRGHGAVINISSDAASDPYPTWGAYGSSKAALDHLTRIWAAELEGQGVRMWSVDPGEMDTQMHAAAMPEADRATLRRPHAVARALLDRLEGHTPGPDVRFGLEEVA